MKKLILIAGLALAGVINQLPAQNAVIPASSSETVNFTLDSSTASGFMAYGTMRQAQMRVVGTNTVITGFATITVPTVTLLATIASSNVPPPEYSVTNFAGGTVVRGTNGFVGTATFTKPVQ